MLLSLARLLPPLAIVIAIAITILVFSPIFISYCCWLLLAWSLLMASYIVIFCFHLHIIIFRHFAYVSLSSYVFITSLSHYCIRHITIIIIINIMLLAAIITFSRHCLPLLLRHYAIIITPLDYYFSLLAIYYWCFITLPLAIIHIYYAIIILRFIHIITLLMLTYLLPFHCLYIMPLRHWLFHLLLLFITIVVDYYATLLHYAITLTWRVMTLLRHYHYVIICHCWYCRWALALVTHYDYVGAIVAAMALVDYAIIIVITLLHIIAITHWYIIDTHYYCLLVIIIDAIGYYCLVTPLFSPLWLHYASIRHCFICYWLYFHWHIIFITLYHFAYWYGFHAAIIIIFIYYAITLSAILLLRHILLVTIIHIGWRYYRWCYMVITHYWLLLVAFITFFIRHYYHAIITLLHYYAITSSLHITPLLIRRFHYHWYDISYCLRALPRLSLRHIITITPLPHYAIISINISRHYHCHYHVFITPLRHFCHTYYLQLYYLLHMPLLLRHYCLRHLLRHYCHYDVIAGYAAIELLLAITLPLLLFRWYAITPYYWLSLRHHYYRYDTPLHFHYCWWRHGH